jgi:hypothetical protein
MDPSKLKKAAMPKAMGAYLQKKAAAGGHDHGANHPSVRSVDHNSHEIVIETSYRVKVDGKTVNIPLMVDESGNVHCHALPNYQFQSALDMVKAMIDVFPDQFGRRGKKTRKKKKGDSGHTHEHAGKRKAAKKKAKARRRRR